MFHGSPSLALGVEPVSGWALSFFDESEVAKIS